MQNGSSFTDGRRRRATAETINENFKLTTTMKSDNKVNNAIQADKTKLPFIILYDKQHTKFLTFNNCDYEDIDDKSYEEIDLQLVQFRIVEHVSERQQSSKPHNAMARPFKEFAVRLEASDLYKIQKKRNKLLRKLDILF